MVRRTRRRRAGRGLSKKQKTQVGRLVKGNIETKVMHHTLSVAVTATVNHFNIMNTFLNAQGVSSNEFVGKEIRLQSLHIHGSMIQADSSNIIRLIVFRARGDYVPGPGNTELFYSPTNPLFSALDTSFVHEVKWDKVFVLNGSTQNDAVRIVKRYINYKNKRLLLKSVADSSQLWYLTYVSDSGLIPSPNMRVNMTLRIKDA